MKAGLIAFGIILIVLVGGLYTFYKDAQRPLPKNLPPPLQDDTNDQDDQ